MGTEIRSYTDAIVSAKQSFEAVNDCQVDFEKEKYFALQICETNTSLQNKNMLPSLAHAVRNVALCGITLNPAMKLAYLVPRGGKVCLDISYMGLIKIATDSGSVRMVSCQLVYKNDKFLLEQGTVGKVTHHPDPFSDRGDLVGVYTVASLIDGDCLIETMSMEQIKDVQKRSKARSGPWVTDFEEMMRKTCVKRASKYWPKTDRLGEAIQTLNDHEGFEAMQSPATEAAEKVRDEEVPDHTSLYRDELISDLERVATDKGITGYADAWKALATKERKLIGASEHERIKAISTEQAEDAEVLEETPYD